MPGTGRDRALYAGGVGVLAFTGAAVAYAPLYLAPADAVPIGPWAVYGPPVAAALAIVGFGLLVFAVTVFVVSVPQVNWQPWIEALSRLAREHGQEVQDDLERGLWFDAIHGGPRFTINVMPRKEGWIHLVSRRRVRHGVVVLREGCAPHEEWADWIVAARGRGWDLRVEVGSTGVAIATNARLAGALDDFFAQRCARAVVMSGDGLRLELDLPAVSAVDVRIREALDVARSLWDAMDASDR